MENQPKTPQEIEHALANLPRFDHSPPKTVTIKPPENATQYKVCVNVGNKILYPPPYTPANDPLTARALNHQIPPIYYPHQLPKPNLIPDDLFNFTNKPRPKQLTDHIVDRIVNARISGIWNIIEHENNQAKRMSF